MCEVKFEERKLEPFLRLVIKLNPEEKRNSKDYKKIKEIDSIKKDSEF